MPRIHHEFDIGDEVQIIHTKKVGVIVEVKARTCSPNYHAIIDPNTKITYRISGDINQYDERFLTFILP